jgi:energy-coupling factor transport system ATP-binding protein
MTPGRVTADGLGFTYRTADRAAFRDVSVDVAPGACLLVIGPSGSGKSTFALAVSGLIPRDIPGDLTGSLLVDGQCGVVFQDPASQLVMERVEDEVAFGLENLGWPRATMRDRIPEVLADTGLAGLERRRVQRLSGGQQQRLALAGALAPRLGILVLDEPTANLDSDGTAAFFERLRALHTDGSATVVLVEHRVDAAWPLADLVLALDADGAPIDVGSPKEVLARSAERMTAAGIWLPAIELPPSKASRTRRPRRPRVPPDQTAPPAS